MSQRKVKDAKDLETNELIYFKGHAKATYMSDGRSVEEAIISTDEKAEQAITDASIAKNAVATLKGLSNATTAMETLAGQVVQIEENKQKLSELGSKVTFNGSVLKGFNLLESPLCSKRRGYFSNKGRWVKGNESWSGNMFITALLLLKGGITYKLYSSEVNDNVYNVLLNLDGTLKEVMPQSERPTNEKELVVQEDCILGFYMNPSAYVISTSDYTIDDIPTQARVYNLMLNQDEFEIGLKDVANKMENVLTDFTINYTLVNGEYVTSSGTINKLTSYSRTNPIFVEKGTIINVSYNDGTATVAVIYLTDEYNTNRTAVALGSEHKGIAAYTASDDCYIGLSMMTSQFNADNIECFKISKGFAGLTSGKEGLLPVEHDITYDRLPVLDKSNPLKTIRYDSGLCGIFKTVGIIGDSLASGEMQGWNDDGTRKYIDIYELSWGQQMAKKTGMDVYNFSRGGYTAKRWMTHNNERAWDPSGEKNGASKNPKQCYFIGLAHNDYDAVRDGTYSKGIGTVDDINLSDSSQNEDSYVGWYGKIIQSVKSIEPRAYIFCITTPPNATYAEYNQKVREIVSKFSGNRVYLIDLERYAVDRSKVRLPWNSLGNHLSSAGYLYSAYEIMTYMDWIIRNNGSDFQFASLVGTDALDEKPL